MITFTFFLFFFIIIFFSSRNHFYKKPPLNMIPVDKKDPLKENLFLLIFHIQINIFYFFNFGVPYILGVTGFKLGAFPSIFGSFNH